MFGVSFPEFLVLGTVALLVIGPSKLPSVLRTVGNWIAKLRKLTTEVRNQSGIDDVLRSEGLDGGLSELRSLMRGGISGSMLAHSPAQQLAQQQQNRAVPEHFIPDKSREYPVEGPDAYGVLPEDLLPTPEPSPPPAPPVVASAPEASDGPKGQA